MNNSEYLIAHGVLRQQWLTDVGTFADLSAKDQLFLHRYFRPSEALEDLVLLAHRKAISRELPSLPQCAGRAYSHFQSAVTRLAALRAILKTQALKQPVRAVRGSNRHVTVRAVMKPTPNLAKYARAVIALAETLESPLDEKWSSNVD